MRHHAATHCEARLAIYDEFNRRIHTHTTLRISGSKLVEYGTAGVQEA